jgi:hypothetical protein
MNNGKRIERSLEPKEKNGVPEAYLAYARWLLENPAVLEVWSLVSDLPEIAIPEAEVTLDAGTWFLCRVSLPPIPGESSIICFVPNKHRAKSRAIRHGDI